jgi:calcium-dependent protein kinase
MLMGVKHCHDNGVVHRDLKPENFLLVDNTTDAPLKITDFGLSYLVKSPDEIITEACGSAYYIAPEIFKKRYTKSVDAWALGVILFLLLSGTVPFGYNAETESEVYKAIQRDPLVLGKQWNSITPAARELVCGLLEKDPYKRYTIEQAIAHPWVTGDAAADVPIDKSLIQSMCEFNLRNRFKKEALKLVASTLSAADVQSLRAQFEKIDNDGSGFITFAEMAQTLQESGMSRADIDALMKRLDQDGDGRISWPEFLEALVDQQLVYHQNNIWWAFCEYDKDGDGKITADELSRVMKDESPDKIRRWMAEFDANNDGHIDYEEFMKMLLPKSLLKNGIKFVPNQDA